MAEPADESAGQVIDRHAKVAEDLDRERDADESAGQVIDRHYDAPKTAAKTETCRRIRRPSDRPTLGVEPDMGANRGRPTNPPAK